MRFCVAEIDFFFREIDFYKGKFFCERSELENICDFLWQKLIFSFREIDFFKEIIAKEDIIHDFFEEENMFWVDDIPVVNTHVLKKLNNLKEKTSYVVEPALKNYEDSEFSTSLFENFFTEGPDLEKQIIEKTPNWEFNRIAILDVILIKLALCEFNFYPNIPFRVTINEYIEISKEYCNEKSSIFINGILDRISKEYQKNNTVQKNN